MNGALDGTKTGKFYGDKFGRYLAILESVGNKYNLDFTKPWNELTPHEQNIAMHGCDSEEFHVVWKFKRKAREGEHEFSTCWLGFSGYIQEEYDRKCLDKRGLAMLPLFTEHLCTHCDGSGLNMRSLQYTIGKKNIQELSSLELVEFVKFFKKLSLYPNEYQINSLSQLVFNKILPRIISKLNELIDLGLGYLTLSRRIKSISGGELQRLRLASYICGNLSGITYVLDEPTVGLHPRDTINLISSLRKLIQAGNTVIVVEHDRDMILAAENIVELGPGAGVSGGELLYHGAVENLPTSISSGKYLNSVTDFTSSSKHSSIFLKFYGASANNLKNIDVTIPLNCITVITGVSGSGKTSLLKKVIFPSLQKGKPINSSKIIGLDQISEAILVDQSPIAKSSISTTASFTKTLDIIRNLFAKLEESKQKGYTKSHFSYLNKISQCPRCKGRGSIAISMDFLSNIETVCDMCNGYRYNDNIMEIKLSGMSISDVLDFTIDSALNFFNQDDKLQNILGTLSNIGLGYIKLGQSLNTLSGGEAQRLKLAKALLESKHKKGSIYLLDEPSTGLHFSDIANLQKILNNLCKLGNSVIVVEHNTDIIRQADWVIDLGPEGGNDGGELIAEIEPKNLMKIARSITGKFL